MSPTADSALSRAFAESAWQFILSPRLNPYQCSILHEHAKVLRTGCIRLQGDARRIGPGGLALGAFGRSSGAGPGRFREQAR